MTLENVDRIQAHGVVVLKALDLLVTCLKKGQDRKLVKAIQGVSHFSPFFYFFFASLFALFKSYFRWLHLIKREES